MAHSVWLRHLNEMVNLNSIRHLPYLQRAAADGASQVVEALASHNTLDIGKIGVVGVHCARVALEGNLISGARTIANASECPVSHK